MISKSQIILTILVAFVICSYLANSQTLNTNIKRCNQIFRGVYQGFYYNRSVVTPCSSNCYMYKETRRSNFIEIGGSCNNEPCNGGLFISRFNYSYTYSCCNTDLCNTFGFSNTMLSYTCEFNKTLKLPSALIYPHRRGLAASIRQCFFCNQCNTTNPGVIVNCTDSFPSTVKTACQYSTIDMGTYSLWSGSCIDSMDMYSASYERTKTKYVGCQSELCNSITSMARLVNATLCLDGFYI